MKPKATTKSRATAKSIASIKAKAIITKTNAATKTKATTKTKTTAKTKAVIYDSDGEVDDAMEEEMVSPGGEEPLYTPMESFNISRKRKLSVGHFRNGDAFIDIRESYPCKTSKRFRRGRGNENDMASVLEIDSFP
ncbi:uncharacterized protein ATC70_010400 [Mucor velutinosus]|uniref:Uncharacterized protein n=1 Tax=Mucor velutinosus TaxID=708070 RepID=A0AAN7DEN1_9FUNG|nr:hypothetical protein ATC70_010400 [Mucor velutinosus]